MRSPMCMLFSPLIGSSVFVRRLPGAGYGKACPAGYEKGVRTASCLSRLSGSRIAYRRKDKQRQSAHACMTTIYPPDRRTNHRPAGDRGTIIPRRRLLLLYSSIYGSGFARFKSQRSGARNVFCHVVVPLRPARADQDFANVRFFLRPCGRGLRFFDVAGRSGVCRNCVPLPA